MMYLLDTNVLSELMRPQLERRVVEWLDSRDTSDLWISAITAAELRVGVARLPEGTRQKDLNQRIEQALSVEFAGRCVPYSCAATSVYARIVFARTLAGHPMSTEDAQIAAVAGEQGLALVTRNGMDFENLGLTLINPWIN